jgi:hypothetical protein
MISQQFNAHFFATGDRPYPGYMIVEIIEDVTAVKTMKLPVQEKP